MRRAYSRSRNEWFILEYQQVSPADDPCGVWVEPRGAAKSFSVAAGCDEIHIYGDNLWSFSDLYWLADIIPEHLRERQFIVHGIAPYDPLADELRRLLPRVRFTDPADLPLRRTCTASELHAGHGEPRFGVDGGLGQGADLGLSAKGDPIEAAIARS